MTEKRLVVLLAAFALFVLVIQLNMVYINVSDIYAKEIKKTQTREYAVDDGRAVITDCNFEKITNTASVYKTLVTAYDDDLQQVFNALNEKDKQNFEKNINSTKCFLANIEHPVEGRGFYSAAQRYTDFNIAQHLIGYTDMEGNGIAGLEKAFDAQLKNGGTVRYLQTDINGYGQITGVTETERVNNDTATPIVLSLTTDNTIQRLCEGIAKEYIPDGSIVVMETKTGQIKAMVSTPFYSANNVAKALTMENSPLVNKALQSYEPGSVIKPLWAAVLLENGFDAYKKYNCKGWTQVN
ncbi:MAG: hypothetical protein IIV99_01310, partial [Oscillospiraceae bacterium]|nr:hypothetical protein [Oscillospiraceae bacterium]